jgi:hypothetical protein
MQAHEQDRQTALQQFANAANDKLAANAGEGASRTSVFRVATDRDRNTEFAPLLTRKLHGQDFQILRPLAGEQTLVLAWSSDCRAGVSPRTIRVQPHATHAPRPTRARARSRGVEW